MCSIMAKKLRQHLDLGVTEPMQCTMPHEGYLEAMDAFGVDAFACNRNMGTTVRGADEGSQVELARAEVVCVQL